ncbi:MAG: helix-turn-helix domain-containing protein [Cyanobacteria bacterium P01_G01_bin.54]
MTQTINIDSSKVDAKAVLAVFAQYGFRKTSMEDIAKAANLSRQSIYKKFGSKDACYEWTLKTYLADMYGRIFATLNNEESTPLVILTKVFDIMVGEAIDLIANLHGTELLDNALKLKNASEEDWPIRFRSRLGNFLHRTRLASTADEGLAKAFVLITAGKGLLLEATDRERARSDMARILEAVVGAAR